MADPQIVNSGSPAKITPSNDSARSEFKQATSQEASQRAAASAATSEKEPKSPPLPTRHTAITPGPRATRLQEAYNSSLSHTLSRLGWDNFAACYPTIAARAPDTLRHVQKQMVERLGLLCEKEFASILQSRNVVGKLNELETLVSEAARRKEGQKAMNGEQQTPTPPHLLPASTVLAAHLAPHLASQQSQLNAKLQTSQAHNRKLFEEIQAQRAELAALMAEVERAVADVDGANGLLGEVGAELADETRAVEVEMGGT